jgi:hypothetical protein
LKNLNLKSLIAAIIGQTIDTHWLKKLGTALLKASTSINIPKSIQTNQDKVPNIVKQFKTQLDIKNKIQI